MSCHLYLAGYSDKYKEQQGLRNIHGGCRAVTHSFSGSVVHYLGRTAYVAAHFGCISLEELENLLLKCIYAHIVLCVCVSQITVVSAQAQIQILEFHSEQGLCFELVNILGCSYLSIVEKLPLMLN